MGIYKCKFHHGKEGKKEKLAFIILQTYCSSPGTNFTRLTAKEGKFMHGSFKALLHCEMFRATCLAMVWRH